MDDLDPEGLDRGEPDPDLDAADLDPREAARMRRRDHEAEAESRSLMRPGMGKVFKQIQDSWAGAPDRSGRKAPKARRHPRH